MELCTSGWSRLRLWLRGLACGALLATPAVAMGDCNEWRPLGAGMTSGTTVQAMATYNGELVAGGRFTIAGGISAVNIARWDGAAWHPLGSGFPGSNVEVLALTVFNGDLIAGGRFVSAGGAAANYIARWDGAQWHALGTGMNTVVRSLAVYQGALYAGGEFLLAGGAPAQYIARWNGTAWSAVPGPISSPVYAMAVFGGELIAGSYAWNGFEWRDIEAPVSRDFAVHGDELYAVGIAFEGEPVARWSQGVWHEVPFGGIFAGTPLKVASYNGNIVVGGEFTVSGGAPGDYIARWNGVSWDTMGGGITGGFPRAVESLHVHDGDLLAGGRFTSMGGVSAFRIAAWDDCGGGPVGEVVGTVRDRATGEPLEFATVTLVDGPSVQTGPGGSFEFLDVPAGAWTIRAEAMEYYPRSRAIEVVEASRTIVHSLLQKAEPGTEPAVIGVTSPVCGPEQRAYFLDGIAVSQTFEATVDWRGHPPGEVQFITPSGVHQAQGGDTTWTATLSIGTQLELGQVLKVKAIASGGVPTSEEYEVNLAVISIPQGFPSVGLLPEATGPVLKYRVAGVEMWLDEGISEGIVPSDIPLFGGAEFKLGVPFTGKAVVEGSGTAIMELATHVAASPQLETRAAGFGVFPSVTGSFFWQYNEATGTWTDGGEVNFRLQTRANVPPKPDRANIGTCPACLPLYWRGAIEFSFDTSLAIESWTSPGLPKWTGVLALDPFPQAEAAVGIGVADRYAGEAFLAGGGRIYLNYFDPEPLDRIEIFLTGEYRLVLGIFTWSYQLFEHTFEYPRGGPAPEGVFGMLPRDYLEAGRGYARFVANSGRQRGDPQTTETAIQTNVFGYSTPALAPLGDDLLLVWVYDDPARTPTNRTMLVYSHFDATTGLWSTPAPVADDGTADFEPRLATLPDGSVLLVWENVAGVLQEPANPNDPVQLAAKFEELKSETEIAAARFDPGTGWSPAQSLSDNSALDRSPRISAGTDGTAMVVWVMNPANDDIGSAARPNTVRAAVYDGQSWGAPQSAAVVGSIVTGDFAYHNGGAQYVFATDLDGDLGTDDDRELVRIGYSVPNWGSPVQVTTNTVVDANPRVVRAGGGLLVAWLQDERLMSTTDLFQTETTAVEFEGRSSGSGDFRMARGVDGRIALVWQNASEGLADLWYAAFDPASQVWGLPQLLTSARAIEYAVSPVFDASGDLVAAFNRAPLVHEPRIVTLPSGPVEVQVPVPAEVDLYVLRRIIAGDLAAEAIFVDPPNPRPEEEVEVVVVVENRGDRAAPDVEVDLYDGEPGAGGVHVGRAVVPGVLRPGDRGLAVFEWTTPVVGTAPILHAVVDPDEVHDDFARANNTMVLGDVLLPDLVVEGMLGQNAGPTDRLVVLRIGNIGGEATNGPFRVTLRKDSPDGDLLAALQVAAAVSPGSFVDLDWLWEDAAPFVGGLQAVYAIIDESGEMSEYATGNNVGSVLLLDSYAPPPVCYANCDGSTVEPVLNVDDFTCFINQFAGAQVLTHEEQVAHYANCDGSTVAPALNVDDFTCFINAYAMGCP